MQPALSVDPNSGCRGSFQAPSLDNQVNIRSTGILGRRIHVNVDFDTEREYSSNNDVQIYHEGLEDEIGRRVDVGTVTLLPGYQLSAISRAVGSHWHCHPVIPSEARDLLRGAAKSAIVDTAPVLGFRPVHLTTHS